MFDQLLSGKQIEKDLCTKFDIPLLNIDLKERLRSLLAYRNDRFLFRRKCDFSSKPIIGAYRPDCGYKIVTSEIWWGDSWDAMDSGFKADPNLSFFKQFYELKKQVPREGTSVVRTENCDYNSHTRDSKNCYLSHLAVKADNLLYSYWTVGAKDVVEGFYTTNCELCARSSYVTNCYSCVHLSESANCNDCFFSFELKNCSDCLFCCNLNNKKFYVRNQQVSKEQFAIEKEKAFKEYQKSLDFLNLMLVESPRRAQHSLNSDSVIGDHIQNSKSIYNGFDQLNSELGYNVTNGSNYFSAHTYSVDFSGNSYLYNSVTIRDASSEIFFSMNCWSSNQLWYCDNCVSCKNCFGSVGLKRKSFCIFNVQYTEQQYQELFQLWKTKMLERKEFGLFFPIEHSPFSYDESAAQDFFPLDREEIIRKNWKVSTIESVDLTSVESKSNKCLECSKNFKIIEEEKKLYKKLNVPFSKDCPECRIRKMVSSRNPYNLEQRKCELCKNDVLTNISTEKAKTIWCESCYIKEVF